MKIISDDKDFYPTPFGVASEMLRVLFDNNIKTSYSNKITILEPSAGKGDLVEYLNKYFEATKYRTFTSGTCLTFDDCLEKIKQIQKAYSEENVKIECIEKDTNLINILKGKEYKIVGKDFLTFETESRYDLIFMNPPFSEGDKHLLKAIEMQERFGGKIISLLNAETIKNPYSNERKLLEAKLKQYNAQIKFIENGFNTSESERKTDVEVALIFIDIPEPDFKSLILDELERAKVEAEKTNSYNEIVTNDYIEAAIIRYKEEIKIGRMLINEYKKVEPLLMNSFNSDYKEPILQLTLRDSGSLKIDKYLRAVRYKYWYELLHNASFLQNLTSNLKSNYYSRISEFAEYEFSKENILQVQINILKETSKGIEDRTLQLFEELSYKNSMGCELNIHYFSGWKTNDAFKINKKIIVPYMHTWDDFFQKFKYDYLKNFLNDLEKIFCFFDTENKGTAINLQQQIACYETNQQSKNMVFEYFTVNVYKKGTVHIEFTNQKVLDKFNIFGCQHKEFLPPCYGKVSYENMNQEEKAVIKEFQGEKEYNEVFNNKENYIFESEKFIKLLN